MAQSRENPDEQPVDTSKIAEVDTNQKVVYGLDGSLIYSHETLEAWRKSPEAREVVRFGSEHPEVFNNGIETYLNWEEGSVRAAARDGAGVAYHSFADSPGSFLAMGVGAIGAAQFAYDASGAVEVSYDAYQAGMTFNEKMQTNGEWDLKPYLAKEFHPNLTDRDISEVRSQEIPSYYLGDGQEKMIRSDVLGNVVYGVMAAESGIELDNALRASNKGTHETGVVDQQDDEAIKLGYYLQEKYPDGIPQDKWVEEVKRSGFVQEVSPQTYASMELTVAKARDGVGNAKVEQDEPAKKQDEPAKKQDEPAKKQDEPAKKQDKGQMSQAGYTLAPPPEGNISKFISNPMGSPGVFSHSRSTDRVAERGAGMHYATPALNSEKALHSAGSSLSSSSRTSPASKTQPSQQGQTPQAQHTPQVQQASQTQQTTYASQTQQTARTSQGQQTQNPQSSHGTRAQSAQASPASNTPKQQQSQTRASTTQASKNQQGKAPVTSADLKAMHRDVQQENAARNAAQTPQQTAPTKNRGRGAV